MKWYLLTLILATFCLATTKAVRADLFFEETFDGPGIVSELAGVSHSYTLSGGEASTSARNYLCTVRTDYNTIDFVAELVYSQPAGPGNGSAGVFFGIGAADKDGGFFDEPDASIYFLDFETNLTIFPGMEVEQNLPGSGGRSALDSDFSNTGSGLAVATMTKIGDTLTFSADLNNNGMEDYSYSLSLSTNGSFLNSTNSRIFLGSGNSAVKFQNLRVAAIPESSAFTLVGAVSLLTGIAGYFLRKTTAAR